MRDTFLQLVKRVQAISSSTENCTSVKVLFAPKTSIVVSPMPFTKFAYSVEQENRHHIFFRLTPQIGTSSPNTESICSNEDDMIAA